MKVLFAVSANLLASSAIAGEYYCWLLRIIDYEYRSPTSLPMYFLFFQVLLTLVVTFPVKRRQMRCSMLSALMTQHLEHVSPHTSLSTLVLKPTKCTYHIDRDSQFHKVLRQWRAASPLSFMRLQNFISPFAIYYCCGGI